MGAMIISFNQLEMQFSIITKCVPQQHIYSVLALTPIHLNPLCYQRYAEPSDLIQYICIDNLS